jgi:hypothetical protein
MSLASCNLNDNKFWSEDETDEELAIPAQKPFEIKEIIQKFEKVKKF